MIYAIIAAIIVIGDQIFKYWIVDAIELGGSMPSFPGIMHLTYVKNTGGAFSILNEHTWLLTVISLIMIAAIIIFMFKGKLNKPCLVTAAMVLGGAVGNIIDRIVLGYVIDMFEVDFTDYAVFNIADCFVVVGVILFCIFYLIQVIKEERQAKILGKGKMPELERLKKNIDASSSANEPADPEDK